MLGYELWLKEFGVTANMIQLQPMAAGHVTGSLVEVGLDQDAFTRAYRSLARCEDPERFVTRAFDGLESPHGHSSHLR